MTIITYRNRRVALAGPDRFYLAPQIHRLPTPHPLKTFVCFLALYARDVYTGALPGDPNGYRPAYAERYAREALIPQHEFRALARRPDSELASHFGVPLEQVAHRRRDLAASPVNDHASSRGRGYGRRQRRTRPRAGC